VDIFSTSRISAYFLSFSGKPLLLLKLLLAQNISAVLN